MTLKQRDSCSRYKFLATYVLCGYYILIIFVIPIRVMHTYISELGLYSFDIKYSSRMAARCRNTQDINICHVLYLLIAFVG